MSTVTQFQQYFPDFGHYFLNILQTQCTQQFDDYLTKNITAPCSEPTPESCYVANVVNCILSNTSASTNANLAATSVLLGLLPTILLQTGAMLPQYTYLMARRPVLGFLLAMSTAPVSTAKASDYAQPGTVLQPSSLLHPHNKLQQILVLILEYLFAMGAMINLLLLMWQLTTRSTLAWAQRFTRAPTVWITTALAIHLASYMVLRLNQKIVRTAVSTSQGHPTRRGLLSNIVSYVKQEFTLSGRPMSHTTIRFVAKRESWPFLLLAWFVSLAAIFHWIYGSVLLAGLLFISVKDALGIALRFIVSTVIARLILMYELGGMRATIEFDQRDSATARNLSDVKMPSSGDLDYHNGSSGSAEMEELSGRHRVVADKR